jgi:hypothetical protein
VAFAKLASWTEHADPAIKYFSGTATYRKTFTLPPSSNIHNPKSQILLDLGGVESLADQGGQCRPHRPSSTHVPASGRR